MLVITMKVEGDDYCEGRKYKEVATMVVKEEE